MGNTGSLRAQYVGTRAVNQPYTTQVNGYQTVCNGCFQPFPYEAPADARFAAVTQLSTGANSHYNGLQLTAEKRLGHGLLARANYTWSHCLDTVSNGGFLPFSAGGIISPLPGMLGRQYGNCDYDIRANFTASYVYELPVHVRSGVLGKMVNGWQVSGTVFYHSGVPFTVQSAPYSANGDGIVQGGGPQFASVRPGVPLYSHDPDPRHHTAGDDAVAESGCLRLDRGPEHGRLRGRRLATDMPNRQFGAQCPSWSGVLLDGPLPDQEVRPDRTPVVAPGRPVLQSPEPSQFCAADNDRRHSGQTGYAGWIWRIDEYHLAAHGTAGRRLGRG